MPRGLDHIVHAVSDLDAAADIYRRCGFYVGARNRHPWGTHNHVVQLPGFFIEILTVAEPEKLGDDGLSRHFGAFQRDAIAHGDGLSMLVVESEDIDADVADFASSGIGTSGALPFERTATMPDGAQTTVGFSLAFARDPSAPNVGFAACRQHNPQAFWNAAYQRHPNGATAIKGVVFAADRPGDHADFLHKLTGVTQVEQRDDGVALATPRGEIEVMTPAAFAVRIGSVPDCADQTLLAGLRIGVAQLHETERQLLGAGLPARRRGAYLVLPPLAACGATLIFEQVRSS